MHRARVICYSLSVNGYLSASSVVGRSYPNNEQLITDNCFGLIPPKLSILPASTSVSQRPRCLRDAECWMSRESATSPASVATATLTQLDKRSRCALSRPHPMPLTSHRGRRRPETTAG